MTQNHRFVERSLFTGVLILIISLALVGIAAAADTQAVDPHGHGNNASVASTGTSGTGVPDNDMMDTCRQMMAGTTMMGPGGAQMMESVEESAMGSQMHDEMQGLVTKMMAGSLSSADQARMVEIMNKYPGVSNMMMTRMIGGSGQYAGMMAGQGMMANGGYYGSTAMMGGAGMMNAGFMSLGVILVVLFFVVWLVVGILAIIWFVKELRKEKVSS